MAINFPSTAGQATDGSYTYTVAGIVYSWNGSSWEAAGAGASATDRSLFSVTTNAAGTAALSYTSGTGVFSYTPPDLSGYLTAESDTLASVTGRGATTSTACEFSNGINVSGGVTEVLSVKRTSGTLDINADAISLNNAAAGATYATFTNGGSVLLKNNGTDRLETSSTGVTISGVLTAGGLTYPNSNGTSGQVLTSDGAGSVTWNADNHSSGVYFVTMSSGEFNQTQKIVLVK